MNVASKVAAVVGLVFVGYMALNSQTPDPGQKPSLDSSQCKPSPTPTQVSKDERQMTLDEKLEILRKLKERLNEKERALMDESASESPVESESDEVIDQSYEHRDATINDLRNNPEATPQQINLNLLNEDYIVRVAAIEHPNAAPENIVQALKDESHIVRMIAIQHPNATSENITQALADENAGVRLFAINHSNATSAHMAQALQDEDERVRKAAKEKASANNSKTECNDTCDLKKKKGENNEEL